MKLPHRLLPPLLVAALGATAPAQSGDLAHERRYFNSWPGAGDLASLAFERAAIGSFGVDPFPDAAVLAVQNGTRSAFQLSNLERFNAAEPLVSGAVDVAVLPEAGNGRDGILVATSAGLKLFRSEVNGVSLSCGTCSTTVVSSPTWNAVTRIWVVRAADGARWVLGYDEAGGTLLRLRFDGSTFSAQSALMAPTGLDEVLAMDFDGAGERELVFWADPYAMVTDWSGNLLTYYDAAPLPGDLTPPGGAQRRVGVSRGSGASAQQRDLLVIYFWSSLSSQFYLYAVNGGAAGLVSLGDRACRTLTTLRYDADALQEVVLGSSTTGEMHLVRRVDTSALLELSAAWGTRIPLVGVAGSSVAPEAPAVLAGADLDGDADGEVIAFQAGNRGLQVVHAKLTHGWAVSDFGALKESLVTGPGLGGLTVEAQLPLNWPAMGGSQSGPTHILYEGWLQPDATSSVGPQRALVALSALPAMPSPYVTPPTVGCDLSWTGTYNASEFVLQLYCTPVRVGPTGAIERYFPSRLLYFTPDSSAESALQTRVDIETYGNPELAPPQGPGDDGDGNVSGSRGGNTPPGPPPSGGGGGT